MDFANARFRARVVVLKFLDLSGLRSQERQNRKPHSVIELTGVLSMPKFARAGPQTKANFGIRTLACQRCLREGVDGGAAEGVDAKAAREEAADLRRAHVQATGVGAKSR